MVRDKVILILSNDPKVLRSKFQSNVVVIPVSDDIVEKLRADGGLCAAVLRMSEHVPGVQILALRTNGGQAVEILEVARQVE